MSAFILLVLSALTCDLAGFPTGGDLPNSEFASGPDQRNAEDRAPDLSPRSEVSQVPSLGEVDQWLYYIDVNLDDETTDQIVGSSYDMVVIDYIPSEENNSDFPLTDLVNRMHLAESPKLVIAYIDIGQAEDFRTYWQPDWGIGNPEWIIALDPDGWEGNYPVAYWWDEYQDLWLGEDGYLQGILAAGFDGVYLDWIEAYSDENVIAFAERDGVDPLQEMIWWVGDIAEHARRQDPDFIVIGQNAAELAERDDYGQIHDSSPHNAFELSEAPRSASVAGSGPPTTLQSL